MRDKLNTFHDEKFPVPSNEIYKNFQKKKKVLDSTSFQNPYISRVLNCP